MWSFVRQALPFLSYPETFRAHAYPFSSGRHDLI